MNDRYKYRIPMFTDKGHFIEYQYVSLGDIIEVMLCGYNGEPEQCTGLRDRKGNLIYEGDVVRTTANKIGVVKWVSNRCKFVVLLADDLMWLVHETQEIIGNIHEQKVAE